MGCTARLFSQDHGNPCCSQRPAADKSVPGCLSSGAEAGKMKETPFSKASSILIILSLCCVLRPWDCWGQGSEKHDDYTIAICLILRHPGPLVNLYENQIATVYEKKVCSWKIHKKMQFVGSTSSISKTIKRADVKEVVPKHVQMRRAELESGFCDRLGFVFG